MTIPSHRRPRIAPAPEQRTTKARKPGRGQYPHRNPKLGKPHSARGEREKALKPPWQLPGWTPDYDASAHLPPIRGWEERRRSLVIELGADLEVAERSHREGRAFPGIAGLRGLALVRKIANLCTAFRLWQRDLALGPQTGDIPTSYELAPDAWRAWH